MKLQKRLTPEKHAELADRIRRVEEELWQVLLVVSETYGVSDRAAVRLEQLVSTGTKIGIINSLLDDKFYQEGHDRQGPSPYYGRRLTGGSTLTGGSSPVEGDADKPSPAVTPAGR